DGAVKIADFGIAKLGESTSLTQSGFVIGTPSYMSPEQAQGRIVDGRADQFSLAVVAFRIVTGRLPFEGPTLTALLTKILWEEPEYDGAGMSPALQPVFKRALSKDPQLRFPACGDFVRALEEVLAAGEPGRFASVPSATGRTAPTDGSDAALAKSAAAAPKRKILWTGSAVLVFLALALTAIFLFRGNPKPAESVPIEELNSARTPSGDIAGTAPPSEPLREAAAVQQPPPARPDPDRNSASLSLPAGAPALPDAVKQASPGAEAKPKEAEKAPVKEPSPRPDTVKTAAGGKVPPPDAAGAAAKEPAASQLNTVSETASKETEPYRSGVTGAAAAENSLSGQKQPENAGAALPATSGVLTWSGELRRNSILVISGQGASIGTVVGQFPGKPIRITLEPGTPAVRQPPGEANGWSQIILYSGNREYSSIEIRWSLAE
ncbi:MAG: serine/threonine protein kinase, partial [Acidobacteria bacterium]|nr:serine/threonine protein kinase [Acidobacteriota bacterium]